MLGSFSYRKCQIKWKGRVFTHQVRFSGEEGDCLSGAQFVALEVDIARDAQQFVSALAEIEEVQLEGVSRELDLCGTGKGLDCCSKRSLPGGIRKRFLWRHFAPRHSPFVDTLRSCCGF